MFKREWASPKAERALNGLLDPLLCGYLLGLLWSGMFWCLLWVQVQRLIKLREGVEVSPVFPFRSFPWGGVISSGSAADSLSSSCFLCPQMVSLRTVLPRNFTVNLGGFISRKCHCHVGLSYAIMCDLSWRMFPVN